MNAGTRSGSGVVMRQLVGLLVWEFGSVRAIRFWKILDDFVTRKLRFRPILTIQRIYCVKGQTFAPILQCSPDELGFEWVDIEIVTITLTKKQLIKVQLGWSNPAGLHEESVAVDRLPFVLTHEYPQKT
jgi:hypothetical protein